MRPSSDNPGLTIRHHGLHTPWLVVDSPGPGAGYKAWRLRARTLSEAHLRLSPGFSTDEPRRHDKAALPCHASVSPLVPGGKCRAHLIWLLSGIMETGVQSSWRSVWRCLDYAPPVPAYYLQLVCACLTPVIQPP